MKTGKMAQKKLHSQSGETIGETLVALLISSLALVMLASMITSTVNLVTKSETKMNDYYKANTALENPDSGTQGAVVITSGETEITVPVRYAKNNIFSKLVVAYSVDSSTEENNTDGG